ncbi:MAG TPA: tetratricopeptide repeat protein, partial [Flavobacteriales bacterium]|nr:tetratricopeptide repeat protein [Flavobacteriales bacterium]
MKNVALIIISLMIYINSYGQNTSIDSLNRLYQTAKTDVEKVEILRQLNDYLVNTDTKALIDNNKKIIDLSKKLQKPQWISEAYRYLSEAGLRTHHFDEAKTNAEMALKIDDSLKNDKDIILDYNQLGRAYYYFNQPEKAIETYKKAVKIYEKHPVGEKIGVVYGNIGAAYNSLNKPYLALQYFLKQAEIAEQKGSPVQKSKVNYSIGYTYTELEQYPKSETYFFKALKDSAKINVKDYVFVNYHALGALYSKWGKYQKALEANKKALAYFNQTGNKLYQFDLHNINASIYLKLNQKNKAVSEAKMAKELAKQVHYKVGIDAANTTLADIYTHFGDYKKAEPILNQLKQDSSIQHHEIKEVLFKDLYLVNKQNGHYKESLKYLEKLKKLSDSILKSQRDNKIAEVETRYQTEKKEKENLKLKAEKAQQELLLEQQVKKYTYLGAAFGVSLISLGIFAFYYRRNKRQKELIEHLQKDLHHRIKNNLAVIDALIEDIKDEFDDEAIHQKLVELQNRINSINEIHRQLYHNKDITNLNLKTYIDKIGQPVKEAFGNNLIQIDNKVSPNIKLDVKTSFPIGLITNEFITNSFKYAFEEGQEGVIEIDLKDDGKYYTLTLKDNGKGLPEGLNIDQLDSFGLSIMKL